MRYRTRIATLASLLLSLTITASQNQYLVLRDISIKTTDPAEKGVLSPTQVGNRFLAKRVSLRDLLFFCNGLPEIGLRMKSLIVDGPEWGDTDRFDVEGKIESDNPVPMQEMQKAVLALLENRFQLRLHHETREVPVFNLVVGNGDLKLKKSQDQTPPAHITHGYDIVQNLPRGALASGIIDESTETFVGNLVPISALLAHAQGLLDRLVFDKTGLSGLFDFSVQFNRPGAVPFSGASYTAAILRGIEEIGLRLEPTRGPLEVLVIDHAEKPSEN